MDSNRAFRTLHSITSVFGIELWVSAVEAGAPGANYSCLVAKYLVIAEGRATPDTLTDNALATVVSGAPGDADVLSPLSTRFADPFPTGRKFAAGIVKSFPTGRKYRKNSIDNISCLCASLRMR